MSVKTAQTLAFVFYTYHPETGALCDADSTPVCTLYVSGVADAATVTVTNLATGKYKGSVTMPTLSTAGVRVSVGAAATVAGVSSAGTVFSDEVDSARPGEVYGRLGAPEGASIAADIAALPTDDDVNAQCDQAIADAAIPAGVRTELETELGRIDENVSAAKTLTPGTLTNIAAAVWEALDGIGAYILRKLGMIGLGTISVVSPVKTDGTWAPLVAGDDYKAGTDNQLSVKVSGIDLEGATVVCNIHPHATDLACTVTPLVDDEDGYDYEIAVDNLPGAATSAFSRGDYRREFERTPGSPQGKRTFGTSLVKFSRD